ncbi:MAG: hypothetical protein IPM27_12475 [Nitrosomonadales bacterium]|nr:hypothetical protein [Nitrosomonadales bacterium]
MLLFALQGSAIVAQPLVIAMLAVRILIQVLFNSGLALVEPPPGCGALRHGTLGADRCEQFLRAGGGYRHQPVRFRVRCGAGDRGRRADRGSSDADGGEGRQCESGLVRAGE